MGKTVVEEEKKKKKKGRPSLLDLQKRNLREHQQQQLQLNNKNKVALKDVYNYNSAPNATPSYNSAAATPIRRSTRRNPDPSPEMGSDGEEDDELEGNRREKDLKLVLKCQKSNSNVSDSDENAHKRRKINAMAGGSGSGDYEKGEVSISGTNPTTNNQGAQSELGPSTPLPDKTLLQFILDRLQKKDTYGVFSEPVDPEELPDYHEVIEHPMDFGTLRKKLTNGAYASLEQFEEEVFLICSNAMQYNAPDTIYFRQARSIHELAKKSFENLRQDSDDNEPETKVVRRGRPPTKIFKKPLGRPPLERARSDFSSDATLASVAENTALTNQDLRKGTLHLEKSGFTDSSGRLYGSRNDGTTGWLAENKFERNDEVSLSKGYSMKHGKKQFVLDENRRNTYKLFNRSVPEPSVLTTFDAERKHLMTVGLHSEHGYTRSLSRFTANIGHVAWKIAAKRIEKCLPAGVKFGPGWVVENDVAPQKPLLLSSPTVRLPSSSQPLLLPENFSSTTTRCTVELKGNELKESHEGENSSEKPAPSTHSSLDGHIRKLESSNFFVDGRSQKPCKGKAEVVERLNLHAGMSVLNGRVGAMDTRPTFPMHESSLIHPGMNGSAGTYRYNTPGQVGKLIGAARPAGFSSQTSQMLDRVSRADTNFVLPVTASCLNSEDPKSYPSISLPNSESEASAPLPGNHQLNWQGLSPQQITDSGLSMQTDAVPPDLNIRFDSPGSPSSSQVDSAQPDLALQL